MTAKKTIGYFLVIMAICLALPLKALSQGYAGPNKTILKDSSVVIGGSGCSSCCYLWTPATGLSDPKILHPIAKPTTTTTYTLKVTGDNFKISDVSQMTVTVKDGMDGLTVTPNKCCWKKGDSIGLSQFTIVTDPPGLENTVTISPTTVPGNIFLGFPLPSSTATLPVTFTARGPNNTTKTATVNISCVDEDVQGQVQVGTGALKVAEILEGIDDITNKVSAVLGVWSCQPTGGWSQNMSFSTGKLCCDVGCIKDMYAYNGTINYDKGIQCDFPFYGIPYAGSINFRVMASAGVAFSLGNIKTTCEGADNCINVAIAGNIGGGLSATIAGGKIIDMSIMLVGQINTPPWEYCIVSGKFTNRENSVCFKLDAVGSITLLGYITESVSVSVINQRCY
ncbi:MAG: hypothetical protein ACOYO1_12250 [Bacteroidales bacterium]